MHSFLLIGHLPTAFELLTRVPEDYFIWLLMRDKGGIKRSLGKEIVLRYSNGESKRIVVDGVSFSPYELAGEFFDVILLNVMAYEIKEWVRLLLESDLESKYLIVISNALGIEKFFTKELAQKYSLLRCITDSLVVWGDSEINILREGDWYIGELFRYSCDKKLLKETENYLSVQLITDYNEYLTYVWKQAIAIAALYYPAAILNCEINFLVENIESRKLVEHIVREGINVARSFGVNLGRIFGEIIRYALNLKGFFSPIKELWKRGLRSEVDFYNGAIYELGAVKGISAPVNMIIRGIVKSLEALRKLI